MEEKIKVYVDSNEKDFITDCYLADNTKIICEFYHEESEIEYSNCKLLNLQEYDKQKAQRIAELEQELAKYKDLQDRLGLENADEFEWFVMLDLLTDNEKNMHILDLHRELAELKEKDNYHLRYELAGADETITNLKQQLEEKDKDKTQLAIQELEKVKNFVDGRTYCANYIKKRIKELKGECNGNTRSRKCFKISLFRNHRKPVKYKYIFCSIKNQTD